jgi:hypothetical protein
MEGQKTAGAEARQAAKQQTKEVRSALSLYRKQAIEERWRPTNKVDKYTNNARKYVAARYLQLKSGHAIIGGHLLTNGKF